MANFEVDVRATLRAHKAVIGLQETGEIVEPGTPVYAVIYTKTGQEFSYAYLNREAAVYIAEKFNSGPPAIEANFHSQFVSVSAYERETR